MESALLPCMLSQTRLACLYSSVLVIAVALYNTNEIHISLLATLIYTCMLRIGDLWNTLAITNTHGKALAPSELIRIDRARGLIRVAGRALIGSAFRSTASAAAGQ
jgi:hypothetical protein